MCSFRQYRASTSSTCVWSICRCVFFSTWLPPQSSLFFSLLRDETQSVVAWGPIKSRFHSCIRWHTYEDFFFPHIWATWWILNGYRTAEDAKILTRCEGRDLQIIRLKQGWGGVLPLNLVLVSRASQCGWLSGSLTGKKKRGKRIKLTIFINHNCFSGTSCSRTWSFNERRPS